MSLYRLPPEEARRALALGALAAKVRQTRDEADHRDLTSERAEQERERAACAADVGHLIRHVWILHPTEGPMAFRPWPWQLRLVGLWAITRLVVVLKARQLGVSWLAAVFALWTAMFRPGQKVLLISKGQDEANELLAKVVFVFHRLPEWLRPYSRENTRTLSFPILDSEIESLPATEGVGRSRTASLVIIDEHGHQRWARKIYLALKPVVEQGRFLSISTANGLGALHTHLYKNAKAGLNGFTAVFIPASAHPQRHGPWRSQARSEMHELSDAEFAQEYPENDVEAFVTTGRPVFRPADLERQALAAPAPGEPGFTLYREPEAGKVYLVGADVAEGLEGSDWSSATVLERDTGEQVAQLRGRWTPDLFAARLDRLARHFARHAGGQLPQPVLVGVERNNHGHAVLLRLGQLHGGAAPYALYRARDGRLGWLTTVATRPVLVDQLEEALRTGGLHLHDAGTVDQFSTFHWSDDGRPEAQEGFHDDDVLAAGIAWQLRRRAFGRILDVPKRPEERAA